MNSHLLERAKIYALGQAGVTTKIDKVAWLFVAILLGLALEEAEKDV